MLSKKIPSYYLMVALTLGVLVSLFVTKAVIGNEDKSASDNMPELPSDCGITVKRVDGYQFIKPLIYSEPASEASIYQKLKADLSMKIEQYKTVGILEAASVYVRSFHQGEWMYLNDQETFNPGSLIKVPVMITMLKMEELHPGFLQSRIKFDQRTAVVPTQTFNSKTIELGKTYSIAELIEYMIVHSDNEATHILNMTMDVPLFKKVFTDLGLAEPNVTDKHFQITPKDYSTFFKVLYNATYLSREHSELALNLLTRVAYKDGMVHGLPANTIVAHKFGEGGSVEIRQLHETGIIYQSGQTPYVLVIMTKGRDVQKLPAVISSITEVVSQAMINQPS